MIITPIYNNADFKIPRELRQRERRLQAEAGQSGADERETEEGERPAEQHAKGNDQTNHRITNEPPERPQRERALQTERERPDEADNRAAEEAERDSPTGNQHHEQR